MTGVSGFSGPRSLSTFGAFKQPWLSLSHSQRSSLRVHEMASEELSKRNSSKGGVCRGDNGPSVTLLRGKPRPYLSVYLCAAKSCLQDISSMGRMST